MTKVMFLSDIVNNNVLPNLNTSMIKIDSLASKIRSLDIPNFSMSGYLLNLPNVMANLSSSCKNDIEYIEKAVENFSKTNDDCCSNVVKTEVYEIIDKGFHVSS